MKKLFALSVVLFSLVGGSVSAFAGGQDGVGVPTVDAPEILSVLTTQSFHK